jgi:hypothetical protein
LQWPGTSVTDVIPVILLENCERRRLVHESICVEPDMHDGAEGAFSAGHPSCIPNSSTSQVRFNESTPISRSCDLFSKGSRKRHPRTLWFDDLIHDLRRSGIVLVVLIMKSVTLAFKGLSAGGVRVDLSN